MAATIPATNKWLLTKQASVARSAERGQAGDGAVQRQGGQQIPQRAVGHKGHPDT